MGERQQLTVIAEYVSKQFNTDATGHDIHHMHRVAAVSEAIAEREGGDLFICKAAGWLHDIGDQKLFENPEAAESQMKQMLKNIELDHKQITHICNITKNVSFTSGLKIPDTLEGRIVQDADRLDAIGAIGIARTFAYGGSKGQLIHSMDEDQTSSVQHFYDKLLKLADMMHTNTARQIAKQRHQFMVLFLEQFKQEWDSYII